MAPPLKGFKGYAPHPGSKTTKRSADFSAFVEDLDSLHGQHLSIFRPAYDRCVLASLEHAERPSESERADDVERQEVLEMGETG